MTATGAGGFLPVIADINAYDFRGGVWSIVTYQAKRRLKCSFTSHVANFFGPNIGVFGHTFEWPVCGEACFTGTFGGGQTYIIFLQAGIHWLAYKKVTSTTYKIALLNSSLTEVGISTAIYTQDVMFTLRAQNFNSGVKIWIDDSLQLDLAENAFAFHRPANGRNNINNTYKLESGQVMYWWGVTGRASNDESDRPGVNPEASQLDPLADTSEDDGTAVGDTNQADCWDDTDADGLIDGDDTYVLFGNDAEFICTSTLVSDGFTFSNGVTVHSVVAHTRARAADDDKICEHRLRIRDDNPTPNVLTSGLVDTGTTVYKSHGYTFSNPPDGGLWEDFLDSLGEFNGNGGTASAQNLEGGILVDENNNINKRVTNIVFEALGLDDDPPPVTTNRRRILAQVI